MGDFKREARAEVLARWLFKKNIYFAFGETVRTLLTGNCFLASWPARLFGLVTSGQPGYLKRRPDKPSQIILPHNTKLHMAKVTLPASNESFCYTRRTLHRWTFIISVH